jgi:uncharacterized protein
MGENDNASWDDAKRNSNVEKHGYDLVHIAAIFDGRFVLSREDTRHDYGERRYNALSEYEKRVVNVTFTLRAERYHIISARAANKRERAFYHASQTRFSKT